MTPLETEAALASIGLGAILDNDPRWNQETAEGAVKWLQRARALVLRFMSGVTEEAAEVPDFNWATVADHLDADDDAVAARDEAIRAALPDDIQEDVIGAASRILMAIQQVFPRSIRKTSVNVTPQEPGPMALEKFRVQWEIATDPMRALHQLVEGSLSLDAVDAFRMLWPELYKAVAGEGGAVDDAIATMKSRRGENWNVDDDRDASLKTLLGIDVLNPLLTTSLSAPEVRQQQPNETGAKAVNLGDVKAAEVLPGQRPIGPA